MDRASIAGLALSSELPCTSLQKSSYIMNEAHPDELSATLNAARPELLRFCVRLVRDEAEAEDLVQQVFLAALGRRDLDLTRPLLPWMRKVARHRAVDGFRARHREQDGLPSQVPDADPGQESRVGATEEASRAWLSVLGRLEPRQRAVLLLRELLDFSSEETAEALGTTPGNVRVLLHRTRAVLAGKERVAPSHARAAAEVLSDSPTGRRYGPRRLLATDAGDMRLEATAAWSLWSSFLEALDRSADRGSVTQVRVILARALALQLPALPVERDLAEARRLAAALSEPGLVADVELVAGVVYLRLGELPEAREAFERVMDGGAPPAVRGYAASGIGGVCWRSGRYREARAYYDRAVKLCEQAGARDALQHNVALLDTLTGELDRAVSRGEEVLASHLAAGRGKDAFLTLNALGMALHNHGCFEAARSRFEQALDLRQQQGLLVSQNQVLTNLGLLDHELGALELAEQRFEAASQEARELRLRRSLAIAEANLGVTRAARGNLSGARTALEAVIELCSSLGLDHLGGFAMAHLAVVLARSGDAEAAREALDAVQRLHEASDDPLMEQVVDALGAAVEAVLDGAEPAERTRRPPGATRSAMVRIALETLEQAVAGR